MDAKQTYRFTCTYQMVGDVDPFEWYNDVFARAFEDNKIKTHCLLKMDFTKVVDCEYTFTVDIDCDMDLSPLFRTRLAKRVLNEIVHDTDIEILDVEPVPGTIIKLWPKPPLPEEKPTVISASTSIKWGEDLRRDCAEYRRLESWGLYPAGSHDRLCTYPECYTAMTEIDTSADFGEKWAVRVDYRDGGETHHGPFENKARANRWISVRLEDDYKESQDGEIYPLNCPDPKDA